MFLTKHHICLYVLPLTQIELLVVVDVVMMVVSEQLPAQMLITCIVYVYRFFENSVKNKQFYYLTK